MSELGARCPNHQVRLQSSGTPGIGICPISGYRFAYEADDTSGTVKIDKFGRKIQDFKVTPLDGVGG